jgi:hypothetical protein
MVFGPLFFLHLSMQPGADGTVSNRYPRSRSSSKKKKASPRRSNV